MDFRYASAHIQTFLIEIGMVVSRVGIDLDCLCNGCYSSRDRAGSASTSVLTRLRRHRLDFGRRRSYFQSSHAAVSAPRHPASVGSSPLLHFLVMVNQRIRVLRRHVQVPLDVTCTTRYHELLVFPRWV